MAQHILKQVRPEEVRPKELNPTAFGPGLEVANNRKLVTFVKEGSHENDVGSIQADQAIPLLCRVYYYEMTIKCKGEKGKFVIGFADKRFNHGRMPGWDVGGFGYCGSDGNKLVGQVAGYQFGPTYTEGDTVGAGIHLHRREIFFTKNSQYLGVAASIDHVGVIAELIPTIGLHSKFEQVEVNFGDQPFKFDLEGMIEEEMRVEREQVEKKQVTSRDLHMIIRDYLLFHGYQHTLEKLDEVCGLGQHQLDNVRQGWQEGLQIRSKIRGHIVQDEVDAAVDILRNIGHIQIPFVLNHQYCFVLKLNAQDRFKVCWLLWLHALSSTVLSPKRLVYSPLPCPRVMFRLSILWSALAQHWKDVFAVRLGQLMEMNIHNVVILIIVKEIGVQQKLGVMELPLVNFRRGGQVEVSVFAQLEDVWILRA
eukprot:TRINITY_DN4289_c0_g1_i5.p1 TRINITY_DN4289_c0_g1~~TRINITY_DN4289_c0_g1_i5.p1  ORF type:complete len:443 (-),score=41.97 TRINITY_DN4289_c0_g1_i5:664-1929(-)